MFLNQTEHTRLQDLTSPSLFIIVVEAADIILSIVAFLVLLFVFWLNCVFWRLSGLLRLVFLFCYSGVPVPVGYLCCHFWCVSCFISEDLSSSSCHCLHFLLRFLFTVVILALSLSLPLYWISVLPFAVVRLQTLLLLILLHNLGNSFPLNVEKQ